MVQSPEALPPPSSLPPPPPWQHPGHHRRPSFWQQAAMQDALKRQYIEAGLPSPVIPIPKASSNSTNTAGLSSFKAAMCHRLQVEPTPRAFVEIDNEALVQYQHELHCLQVRQLEALQRYQLQQLEHLQQQQLQLRLQQDHLRALVRQEEDRALDRGEPRLDLEPAVEPLGAKCEHFGQGTADAAVSKDAERGGHAYNGNRPVQSSVTMAPKVDLDATEDPWMLVEAAKAKRARLKKATKLNTKRKRTSTPGCEELERELRRPRLGSLPAPFSISIKDWVLDKADRSNRATGQYHHHFHLFYPQPAKSADSGINNMAFAADDGSSLEPPEGSMAESMDDSGIDTSTTSSEDEVDEGEHYEPVGAMTLAEAQQSGAGLIWPHDWSGVLQQKEEKEEEEEEEEDEEHEEHEVEQPLSRSLQSTFRALERSEIEAQQCSSSDTGNDADGEVSHTSAAAAATMFSAAG
ncbi:hypothetical protein BGZ73_007518 [Actinomortierella ambigua]|nr:hypothetical protein BGZ73_007518 [Actinomortierella ambigua]